MAVAAGIEVAVDRLDVTTCTIPTDEPESDGTTEWDSTTIVIVEAHAGGEIGLGYTYAPGATATLIREMLAEVVEGRDAFAVTRSWQAMAKALRNAGRPGVGLRGNMKW
jgi:L-alanine-DL-glutamate epimerase-like enolase superfamily enzyme